MSPPSWQYWPDEVASSDWNTYEVSRATGITLNGTTYVGCSFVVSSTELDLIDQCREQTVGTPRLRNVAATLTSAILTDAPYLAVWNATDSDWAIYDTPVLTGGSVVDYTFVDSRSGTATVADFLDVGDSVTFVALSQYDSDIATWTDFA